jgi:hypothetical protein
MIEDITKTPLRKGGGLAIGVLDRLWRIISNPQPSQAGVDRHNEGLNLPGGTA